MNQPKINDTLTKYGDSFLVKSFEDALTKMSRLTITPSKKIEVKYISLGEYVLVEDYSKPGHYTPCPF